MLRDARVGIPWRLAGAAVLVLAFVWPIFRHPGYWGIQDWDQHLFYHEAARLSVATYHQFPLWDPYYCGGQPLLAHPESRFLTPTFALYLLFGTAPAAKIDVALHLLAALAGLYLLARRLELDAPDAFLAASVFAFSSLFAVNLATGDYFAPAAYIPWALLTAQGGLATRRARAACAGVLALMFLEGGPYPLMIASTALFLLAAGSAWDKKSAAPLAGLAAALVLTMALGAVKFLPAVELMRRYPRPIDDDSGFSAQSLAQGLLGRDQRYSSAPEGDGVPGPWRGRSLGVDENGCYVGVVPLTLALLGFACAGRGWRPLRPAFAVLLWLSLGRRIHPSLWAALHRLPVFDTMHVATRFRMAWLALLALFAGAGSARARRATAFPRAAAALVSALVLVDLWLVDRPVWDEAFPIPPLAVARGAGFVQTRGRRAYGPDGYLEGAPALSATSSHFPAVLSNQGLVDCYGALSAPRAAIAREDPGYRGEAWLEGSAGRADYTTWTPNRLSLDVSAAGPAFLVVNQNYDPGWRAADGRAVVSRADRLAVPISPADRRVELFYRPRSFLIGAAITLLTAVGLLTFGP